MADTKFWRILAVCFVDSVFYLGTQIGSNGRVHTDLPSTISQVKADDVSVTRLGNTDARAAFVTTSNAGKTIHVWTMSASQRRVYFVGTFDAKDDK